LAEQAQAQAYTSQHPPELHQLELIEDEETHQQDFPPRGPLFAYEKASHDLANLRSTTSSLQSRTQLQTMTNSIYNLTKSQALHAMGTGWGPAEEKESSTLKLKSIGLIGIYGSVDR